MTLQNSEHPPTQKCNCHFYVLNLVGVMLFSLLMNFSAINRLLIADEPRPNERELSPNEIFTKKILPIIKSPNPSSCAQCHLAGIDLKSFMLPTAQETFRSLRDQGLIDLRQPEKSKILEFIQRGKEDKNAKSLLGKNNQGKTISDKTEAKNPLTQEIRLKEYDAFSAWILACCQDKSYINLPELPPEQRNKPAISPEVIRFGRKDQLLISFEKNVWAYRFRCMNCHIEGTPQNNEFRKKYGDRVAWFKKNGSEETMLYLLNSPLINFQDPAKSLLLQKPLNKIAHKGGLKFAPGDQGYRGFWDWLEQVSALKNEKYKLPKDLPKQENISRFGTDLWLKLENTPDEWGDRLLQINLYAWNRKENDWEKEVIATSDRVVWGKGHLWQHNLTLLTNPGSDRDREWRKNSPQLPPGEYLVKIFVDKKKQLSTNPNYILGDSDYVASIKIRARWQIGYDKMTVVNAKESKASISK